MIFDLDAAWEAHVASVLEARDAPSELHGSDLHACSFALQQRVRGVEQLPQNDDSFANFERGHAYEARLDLAIRAYVDEANAANPVNPIQVTHGEQCEYRGIIGNLDWVLRDSAGVALATIDLSTTAKNDPGWKYGHALKSAFYALAVGAPTFCEWVFCIGFGGKITAQKPHWFSLDEPFDGISWRERVEMAIDVTRDVASQIADVEPRPPWDPQEGEHETLRCGRVAKTGKNAGVGTSYCRAKCPLNAAYTPEELPL